VGLFAAAVDDVANVNITRSLDVGVAALAVRVDRRFQFQLALKEIVELLLGAVGDNGKPNASELCPILLDSASDNGLASGSAPSFAFFRATDPCLVNLNEAR
jgi:hypothetical protein